MPTFVGIFFWVQAPPWRGHCQVPGGSPNAHICGHSLLRFRLPRGGDIVKSLVDHKVLTGSSLVTSMQGQAAHVRLVFLDVLGQVRVVEVGYRL